MKNKFLIIFFILLSFSITNAEDNIFDCKKSFVSSNRDKCIYTREGFSKNMSDGAYLDINKIQENNLKEIQEKFLYLYKDGNIDYNSFKLRLNEIKKVSSFYETNDYYVKKVIDFQTKNYKYLVIKKFKIANLQKEYIILELDNYDISKQMAKIFTKLGKVKLDINSLFDKSKEIDLKKINGIKEAWDNLSGKDQTIISILEENKQKIIENEIKINSIRETGKIYKCINSLNNSKSQYDKNPNYWMSCFPQTYITQFLTK